MIHRCATFKNSVFSSQLMLLVAMKHCYCDVCNVHCFHVVDHVTFRGNSGTCILFFGSTARFCIIKHALTMYYPS